MVDATTKKFVRSDVVKKTADTPTDTHFYVNITATPSTITGNPAVPDNHAHYTVTDAIYVESGYQIKYNGKSWVTTEITGTFSAPTGYTQIY